MHLVHIHLVRRETPASLLDTCARARVRHWTCEACTLELIEADCGAVCPVCRASVVSFEHGLAPGANS